jgi:ABC-2 type transport system ATP-binding protein
MEEIINVGNVWKKYKQSAEFALKNVSLKLFTNEIHVLLGTNGSGKSTLLKLIARLLALSKGEILFKNNKWNNSAKAFKREIGVLFDHNAQWEQLTGYENAWFFASSFGLDKQEIPSRLEYYFKWLNLWNKKDELVKKYSYGMRRKLTLIECLIHDPKILLLDEPSMGLDYHSRVALYQNLKERASHGALIIVASNDVNEAAFLADKVTILSEGKVIATGEPKELMKSLKPYIKINISLNFPIRLDNLRRVEGLTELEIVDNEIGTNDLKLMILAKPKEISSYSMVLADIVNEIVKENGQIQYIDIKNPNLGDLFLKLRGEDYESK